MFMTELHTLINGLKPEEINSVRYSFCKANKSEKEELAVEKLFDFLVTNQGKDANDKTISAYVYGSWKEEALKRLKSRLFSKILDTFTSDVFLFKEGLMDNLDKQVVRIRKKILQFRVLLRKKYGSDKTILFHLLNEILKEAREYEQYDVVSEALNLKKYITVLRKGGIGEMKDLNKQIEYYSQAHRAVNRAVDYYYQLLANQDLIKEYTSSEIDKMMTEATKQMDEDYKLTKSVTILYYKRHIQLAHLQWQRKHQATIDVCLDIINLLKKHKCIFRTERMGMIFGNISKCLVYTGDFNNAAKNAQKAQSYYSSKSLSYMIAKEQEFYALFYACQYERALSIVKELQDVSIVNSGEFRQARFAFFKACICFNRKEYKETLQICNQSLDISRDKNRWDLGTRYLRIMCLVELQLHDQAYAGVEALRKTIGRNSHKSELSSRDELIFKLLYEYARNSFIALDNDKINNLATDLSASNTEYAWNYYTHELIPFHKWMGLKIRNTTKTKLLKKARV